MTQSSNTAWNEDPVSPVVERPFAAPQELVQKLRRIVARRVPAADVDDVLQDVFVRVLRGLPSLRDQERFVPWLYQVAHSAAQQNLRRRMRHPLTNDGGAEQAAPEPEAVARPDTGLGAFAVRVIERLPSPYREALLLTEIEGMSQLAAAKVVGLSPSGMKSRVQRGREKLRDLLESNCKIALDVRGGVVDCEPREQGTCSCTAPEH